MASGYRLLVVTFITVMLAHSKGDLELFVRSDDNDTACPAFTNSTNCRLLSEYATDPHLTLDQNTSFVFLPGQHFLDTVANFSFIVQLSFRPFEMGSSTSVRVNQGGSIVLEYIDIIEMTFLEVQSRGTTFGEDIPIVLQIVAASHVEISHCNFTNNAARALIVMNSTITLVGNQVSYSKSSWLGLDYSNATLTDNFIYQNTLQNEPSRAVIHVANSSLRTIGTNVFSNSGKLYPVVAGVISSVDSEVVLGGNTLFSENTGYAAGVIYSSHSMLVVDGNATFSSNRAGTAGVIYGSYYSIVLYGNATFRGNNALFAGVIGGSDYTVVADGNASFSSNFASHVGVIVGSNYTLLINGNITFSDNYGELIAGVIYGSNHTIVLTGNTMFLRNSADNTGVMDGENYTLTVDGNTTFCDNSATFVGPGVFGGVNYTATFYGNTTFIHNGGNNGGVFYGRNATVLLDGNAVFIHNLGIYGGVGFGPDLRVFLGGYAMFENNSGRFGGVFLCLNSQYVLSGEVMFVRNMARYGGALYAVASKINVVNGSNITFLHNSATDGGAVYLSSRSSVIFSTNVPVSVHFVDNLVTRKGGAVFIQDANTLIYCLAPQPETDAIAVQDCSFQVEDYSESTMYETIMFFVDNFAADAGNAIYGGAVDNCVLEIVDNTHAVYGQQLFDNITFFERSKNSTVNNESTISSDPFIVCYCDGDEPNCTNAPINYTVYPGASIEVTVIALGQRNGTVPATIVSFNESFSIEPLEGTEEIDNKCSNLSYTVHGRPGPGYGSLRLYAEGSCLKEGVGLDVHIEVLSCPPGFVLKEDPLACVCHPSLIRYTDTCSPQDGTILRAHNSEFWVGYDAENDGIILYSSCPFDYCITETITFQVNDSNAQCNHGRSGLLCGECSEGLSLLLGIYSCEKCSNTYLALLLFFAVAGVILVAFLLLLNLTVATGTINGLIFYANIVAANEALVFPSKSNTYLDILKVFIAWINLDFGIKSCFYEGMDVYTITWLQYAFPVYIWALIGLVILISHFSVRATKLFGKNPVAVLTTLILLSYTKILRTIIEAFSSATLDYSQGVSKTVWLNDGNVPFLDTSDGRHLGLFIASLLVLVVFFVPYTLILLTSQWLMIKSHWKVLFWLNKPQLKAFIEPYYAPCKAEHRYWSGLLLLVRLALLVTTSRTLSTNPSVIFLVIQIFVLLLLVWMSFFGGVYQNWYLNILEGFFIVNLGLLSASIQYLSATMKLSSTDIQTSSIAITSTLVTLALAAFLGIIGFHIYLKVKDTKTVKAIISYITNAERPDPDAEQYQPIASADAEVPTTYVSLREPLLDDA